MTVVYVDPMGTLVAPAPDGSRGVHATTTLLPGALEALDRLRDERYELVILSPEPLPLLAPLGDAIRYEPEPSAVRARRGAAARSWLIAADEGWSERARPAGLRTIRVGPRPTDPHRPTARFDVDARDLNAAVMEILTADTMPG
ncbi:MAG TPA: hypothetical protein VF763_06795 [Candidatus Limnocylindrales bacterium]